MGKKLKTDLVLKDVPTYMVEPLLILAQLMRDPCKVDTEQIKDPLHYLLDCIIDAYTVEIEQYPKGEWRKDEQARFVELREALFPRRR